ncbi:hypothetical protein AB0K16_25955, partial [Nonomuraea jabiensis]|uniref:NucA/NucB deoxyribonuclease domain-containing protein n=1 Tax=Nonomuraea jabiensis TaxID=882448 RepID=UPI0034168EAA
MTASVCKNEVPVEDQNKKSCDEFPFESTYQGAARAIPDHNFSVTKINGTMNKQHGNVLKAWYWNNRIINKECFSSSRCLRSSVILKDSDGLAEVAGLAGAAA